MSQKPSFFAELQRRHVYKVGAAYVVAGWLLVQVVTQVFPIFNVSALAQRIIVLAIMTGFPVALVLAWLFDFTSRGVVRTETWQAKASRSARVEYKSAGRESDPHVFAAGQSGEHDAARVREHLPVAPAVVVRIKTRDVRIAEATGGTRGSSVRTSTDL